MLFTLGINFYNEATDCIDKFLKNIPPIKRISEYLKSIIFFEQIQDESKDLEPLNKANKQINYFKKYPDTEYALDLNFKRFNY